MEREKLEELFDKLQASRPASTGDHLVDIMWLPTLFPGRGEVQHLYSDATGVYTEQWKEVETIGQGGFGRVCRQERTDGNVKQSRAVKEVLTKLNGNLGTESKTPEQRSQEIFHTVIMSKRSRYFPKLFGWYYDGDRVCFAVEYAKHGNLASCMRELGLLEHGLPEAQVVQITRQITAAVYDMHNFKVVHRDLKPENIFVYERPPKKDWIVRVGDLGNSKSYDNTVPYTRIQTSCAAPEQLMMGRHAEEDQYTFAVDLFSLGYVVHFLLCGKYPVNTYSHLNAHVTNNRPLPTTHLASAGVSQAGVQFVESLIKLQPLERMSAKIALDHPWLQRSKISRTTRGDENNVPRKAVLDQLGSSTHFGAQYIALPPTIGSSDTFERSVHQAQAMDENPVLSSEASQTTTDKIRQLYQQRQQLQQQDLIRRGIMIPPYSNTSQRPMFPAYPPSSLYPPSARSTNPSMKHMYQGNMANNASYPYYPSLRQDYKLPGQMMPEARLYPSSPYESYSMAVPSGTDTWTEPRSPPLSPPPSAHSLSATTGSTGPRSDFVLPHRQHASIVIKDSSGNPIVFSKPSDGHKRNSKVVVTSNTRNSNVSPSKNLSAQISDSKYLKNPRLIEEEHKAEALKSEKEFNKLTKEQRIEHLKKFSESFKLSTPIPEDLKSIVGPKPKKVVKQAIREPLHATNTQAEHAVRNSWADILRQPLTTEDDPDSTLSSTTAKASPDEVSQGAVLLPSASVEPQPAILSSIQRLVENNPAEPQLLTQATPTDSIDHYRPHAQKRRRRKKKNSNTTLNPSVLHPLGPS